MEMRNFEVSLCLKKMKRKMKISEMRENFGEQSEGEKQLESKKKKKKNQQSKQARNKHQHELVRHINYKILIIGNFVVSLKRL